MYGLPTLASRKAADVGPIENKRSTFLFQIQRASSGSPLFVAPINVTRFPEIKYLSPLHDKEQHTDYPEQELLALVADGDTAAFSGLFDRYYNKVLSQALTYKNNFQEAEDHAQEIFLKVWDNKEKLRAVKSFKNYLFILTRNEMVDSLRKKAVWFMEERLPDLKEDLQLPGLQLEYKETYRLILKGMEELPQQQKLVFRMSRLDGMSNGEIAEKMGIAKTTVRWHIVLALNFLKAFIARHTWLLLFF